MADADESENPDDSDTTESETTPEEGDGSGEIGDDNDTPVIDGEDISDDNQPTEETPDVEEPAEDSVTEDDASASDEDASVDAEGDVEPVKPAEPVITVKNGDSAVTDLTNALPNRATGVTFEIAAVEGVTGVTFRYTFGDTAPTAETGTTYGDAVPVAAPDQDAEGTVKINAIAVAALDSGETQVSDVKTVTVKFAAKPAADTKMISLSGESEEATITIYSAGNEYAFGADAPYSIEDPEQRVYVKVEPKTADTLFEVMYIGEGEEEKWTSAYREKVSGEELYRIPDSRLHENLQLKVVNMRKITLDWQGGANWASVTIFAWAVREDSNYHENLIVFGDRIGESAYDNKIYAPKNTKVGLTISPIAGQNMQLSRIALKKGDEAAAEQAIGEDGTSAFMVSEDIVDDYTLTIDGTASYQRTMLGRTNDDSEWEDVIPDKQGIYNVVPYMSYELSAVKADETDLAIGKVKVKENGADSNDIAVEEINNGVWGLDVKGTANNKTLQVELYVNAADTEPVDTLTLKVAPEIEKVTIKGASDDKITQQTGTVAKYELVLDNKTSRDSLSAAVEKKSGDRFEYSDNFNDYIASVAVENGSLVVRTKAAVKETASAGTIAIINNASGKKVAAVTLETKAPAWVTAKPVLKQAGATDTELILDITAPKGVVLPDEAYDPEALLFYEVTANEQGKSDKKTRYVQVTGQTTRFTFKVNEAELGKGKKATYEVTAALFLYNGVWSDENTKPDGTEIAKSVSSAVLRPATRDPYYADKITFKKEKAASALYTGQYAHVATVDFGKSASYNSGIDVEIYDIPDGLYVSNSDGGEFASAGESITLKDDLKVFVGVDEYNAAPGKYTLKARTTYNKESDNAGGSIVQATATLPLTVVQGIYEIDATAPAKIYKADNKAATAKIAVTYNYNNKKETPKTKKVTYDLVGEEWSDDVITVPGITVANGTIKIDKSYWIANTKNNPDANKYTVRVKAADYAGNETEAFVTFEVTGTTASFGKAALVKYDHTKQGYQDLAPADGTDIPINVLEDAEVVVVRPDRNTVHGMYMEDDIVDPALYTLTPAKGTSIYLGEERNYINVGGTKLGKNLVFKATATDGSKVSVTSNKFNIVYDNSVPEDQVKVVYETELNFGTPWGFLEKGNTVKLDDVPAGTVLTLSVADEDGDSLFDFYDSIFDYTISAKNAKVVKKYGNGLALDVIVNKNPAEITLKKGKEVVNTYKIEIPDLTNDDLKETPKVSLKKGTKIYPTSLDQELCFTMNKAVEGARYVKVSCQNNEPDTQTLYCAIADEEAILNANVKEFAFGLNLYGDELKKGASLGFVFLDRDHKVITKTTNTVKIKTTALKKSYKLNAKYTLSTRDAYRVPLSGKSSGVTAVAFKKLYNANIKGKINQFRNGFTLSDGNLELRTYYDESAGETRAVAEKADWTKNDFIGFVEYTVTYEDESEETFVTKIQVNLKKTDKNGFVPTANKYAASAVSVLNPGTGKVTEGVSTVTIGKVPADIRAAKMVYSSGSGKNITYELEGENSDVQVSKVTGNSVTLTIKGNSKNTTYNKGKLYVLPLSGMYAYDNNYMNWTAGQWRKYGVELKCNVSLKAPNSKSKIKSPAKSVSFLNVEPEKLAVDGKGKMYYYAELPYTVGIFAQIDDKDGKITLVSKKTAKDPVVFAELTDKSLIKVRKVNNKNALGLYIDAEAFRLKVADDKAWSGAVFQQIEMTVPFVGESAVAETIKFNLTMPNPWSYNANEAALAKIIAKFNGSDVNGIAGSSYDPATRTVVVTANDGNVEIEAAVNAQKSDMADKLLADPDVKRWVETIKEIRVARDLDASTTGGIKITNDGDSKVFLIKIVDAYMDKLAKELEEEGLSTPTWGDLDEREIDMTIIATPKTGDPRTESCTVKFIVDPEAGNDLDNAIRRVIKKMNMGPVIESVTGAYDSGRHMITITGDDPELDFIDAKNQSRDKSVQILLSELGEHMDGVETLTFSYMAADGVEHFMTVRKEGRETSEQYIANLVDTWTDKLVDKLMESGYEGDGNPNAFGRLGGRELFVEAKFTDSSKENIKYTIAFVCDAPLAGLDAAITSAVERLNRTEIPGVGGIICDLSAKAIKITGDDAGQDIMASKNKSRDTIVRILLDEMDEYMDEVSEVTFTYENDFITVKRENHESNETYISDLVDDWTNRVVEKLQSDNKPAVYGSLDGKTLGIEVKYRNIQKPARTYTLGFEIQ